MPNSLEALAARLARLATHYDMTGEWPEKSLEHLTSAGAWSWVIPTQYGGLGLDPLSQTKAYEAVAYGCMATLLILTQRDAACELIAGGESERLKDELLPALARHEFLTSVGISQITTSRQGGRPALSATPQGDDFLLTGCAPWVTGAARCRCLVVAAVVPDGRQILAVVETNAEGVVIDPPMQLAALQCTLTSEVHLKSVRVRRDQVVRGPQQNVLASRSTVKPLVVATAGLGHAGAMAKLIQSQGTKTPGALGEMHEDFLARYEAVRERLYRAAQMLGQPNGEDSKTELRIAVNDLLVRLTVAMVTYAKGSGFLRQMDAQRLAREAMFFLVWSAPEDVRAGTLSAILDRPETVTKTMLR